MPLLLLYYSLFLSLLGPAAPFNVFGLLRCWTWIYNKIKEVGNPECVQYSPVCILFGPSSVFLPNFLTDESI